MYRGKEGMWSWIFHRLTGIGVFVFLLAHIIDTALVGWGPEVYNAVMAIYKQPFFLIMEYLLVGALLYHALNGVRIILIDFWPGGTRYQRQMFWIVMILFVVAMIPTGFIMLGGLFSS